MRKWRSVQGTQSCKKTYIQNEILRHIPSSIFYPHLHLGFEHFHYHLLLKERKTYFCVKVEEISDYKNIRRNCDFISTLCVSQLVDRYHGITRPSVWQSQPRNILQYIPEEIVSHVRTCLITHPRVWGLSNITSVSPPETVWKDFQEEEEETDPLYLPARRVLIIGKIPRHIP